MAVTVIGGLLTSTLLTLVLIPAVYTIMDDFQGTIQRAPGRIRRLPARLLRLVKRAESTPRRRPIPTQQPTPQPVPSPTRRERPVGAPAPVGGGSD
jgi:hypothetical protein